MAFAQILNGQPIECGPVIDLGFDPDTPEGKPPASLLVAAETVSSMNDGQRAALGIYTIVEPNPPADKRVDTVGPLEFKNGEVRRKFTTRPYRRLIRKSIVVERIETRGKLDAVWAGLNSSPTAFTKWFSPDWQNVFFDDERMLGLLAAVGCSPKDIAFITAEDPGAPES